MNEGIALGNIGHAYYWLEKYESKGIVLSLNLSLNLSLCPAQTHRTSKGGIGKIQGISGNPGV